MNMDAIDYNYATYIYRTYIVFDSYNRFVRTKKSRKRKEYLRKIFNNWYKCPELDGTISEKYWKMKFNDDLYVRVFLHDNSKLLSNSQFMTLVLELYKHSKKQPII